MKKSASNSVIEYSVVFDVNSHPLAVTSHNIFHICFIYAVISYFILKLTASVLVLK